MRGTYLSTGKKGGDLQDTVPLLREKKKKGFIVESRPLHLGEKKKSVLSRKMDKKSFFREREKEKEGGKGTAYHLLVSGGARRRGGGGPAIASTLVISRREGGKEGRPPDCLYTLLEHGEKGC